MKISDRIPLKELKRLFENLNHSSKVTDQKIRLILILQYYTGLRHGDCRKITFGDIMNNNKLRLIEEKTKKSKIITLNNKLKSEVSGFFKENDVLSEGKIVSCRIQYINRKLKEYKERYNIRNYTNDSAFNFSTHSIRKCSLYEIYRTSGINVSLKISNHQSIDVHLRYICAESDVKDGYLSL